MVNNMRTKMKFHDLLEKNHYKSIIVLLILFEGDRGLRQAHFRYALMDDPELHKYTVIVSILDRNLLIF